MLDTRLSGRKPEREPTRDVGMQEEWGGGGGGWGSRVISEYFYFHYTEITSFWAYKNKYFYIVSFASWLTL